MTGVCVISKRLFLNYDIFYSILNSYSLKLTHVCLLGLVLLKSSHEVRYCLMSAFAVSFFRDTFADFVYKFDADMLENKILLAT